MLISANTDPEWYLVYHKDLQHPWKIHWTGRNLLSYFQADLFGKRRPSKIFGKVVAHCEKQSLSSSHCPFTTWQADNSVSASLPSFKPPPCSWFLCGGTCYPSIKKKKRENCSSGWLCGGALFTCVAIHQAACPWNLNRSVLWWRHPLRYPQIWRCTAQPAEKKTPVLCRTISHMQIRQGCVFVRVLPVAPAGRARWQWISCCCFLTRQSSPVSCKERHNNTKK